MLASMADEESPRKETIEERRKRRLEWHRNQRAESDKRAKQLQARDASLHVQTLQTMLPEGGYFTMTWPETIEPASLDMVEELFKLQWKNVREWVADREKELDVSLPPPPAEPKK